MREGDSISSIFNPRGRPRTPSVVVTSEDGGPASPCSLHANGPFASSANAPTSGQQSHSQQHPPPSSRRQDSLQEHGGSEHAGSPVPTSGHTPGRRSSLWGSIKRVSDSCVSLPARKVYCGVCVTALVTGCWVGATHAVKLLYRHRSAGNGSIAPQPLFYNFTTLTAVQNATTPASSSSSLYSERTTVYDAPFCTTWFLACWNLLFLPLWLTWRVPGSRCTSPARLLAEALRPFREKGFTAARFLIRLLLLTALWLATHYCYVVALRTLLATDVMALFATSVSFTYLLSWVILHEQFVGVRIVAVILCDTGIALLAYMDGITSSPTLGGVVLAASAAAGAAVFKVMLRKVVGPNATLGQLAVCYSMLGLLNALLLWPAVLTLFLSGSEYIPWPDLPWATLLLAAALLLCMNLLSTFGTALTYEVFITLGLVMAVPLSAAVDALLYHEKFAGMKLSGMVLISVGFFLVLFPDNWPDYITRLLRNAILLSHSARWSRRQRGGSGSAQRRDLVDYRTGYIRSHLRSPSGRVR